MEFKQAGVYMDHLEARVLEPEKNPPVVRVVHSLSEGKIARQEGRGADGTRLGNYRATNNEHHKHNIEKEEITKYFKDLADALEGYDRLYIFGPSTAHDEFANFVRKDKRYREKTIAVDKCDYLTDKQMAARVREYFSPVRVNNVKKK